MKYFKAKTF